MRQWHDEKAAANDQDIAAIHISITASGTIKTEGVCLDPEHAQIMLEAIPNLVARLKSAAGIATTEKPRQTNVRQMISRGLRSDPDTYTPSVQWLPNGLGKSGYLDAFLALNRGRL